MVVHIDNRGRQLTPEELLRGEVSSTPTEGVWAVIDSDHYESITQVHETELEALRVLNGRGYGRVAFIPWGTSLADMVAQS